MEKRFFVTRHSKKPKGEDIESKEYKGISKSGVDLARQSATNILETIERSPPGAVIFLGGVSEEPRTRSTAEVYGDQLKKLLSDRKDEYIVITKIDIAKEQGYTKIIQQIKDVIDKNPDKKIIVDIPLFIKNIAQKSEGWLTKEGKPAPYTIKLLEKTKGDQSEAEKYWIENQGEIDGLKGPKPLEVAKKYEEGINRLEQFARKYIGNRPCITGLVGHSWGLDAYLTYLVGEGKIDLPNFEKVSLGKGIIKETEMASVKITPEMTTITYREKETRKKTLEHIIGLVAIGALFASTFFFSDITGNAIGASNIGANFFLFWFAGIAIACALILVRLKK
ncbi:hypothetical protein HY643_04650 [Candidatus Woesearchaeota archaeon]|nr:hypothetical protein [Candidatus Woesearchaeota archaeon]